MDDADTYLTYIIQCYNGELYCGKTKDILKRMKQHNNEIKPQWFGFGGRKPFVVKLLFNGDFEKPIKRAGVKTILNLFNYRINSNKWKSTQL